MTRVSQLALVVGLGVLIAVAALSVNSAQAQETPVQAFQATVTPTPFGDTTVSPTPGTNQSTSPSVVPNAQNPSMIALWDKVCVKKIPYTILAVPESATYEVVQPDQPLPPTSPQSSNRNELACSTAVTFGGKQVVVCTGPEDFAFTIHVTSSGASEDFQVPLKSCPVARPQPAPDNVNP